MGKAALDMLMTGSRQSAQDWFQPADYSAPAAIPPSGEWTGSFDGYGNADFFWFDRGNWRAIVHFILFRADLTGGDAVRTLLRLAVFPLSIAYLLLYAAFVHTRRALRLG